MDVFALRDKLVNDYSSYTRSFIKIADQRICNQVDSALDEGALWPVPLLQLNPTFLPGGTIDDLVSDKTLHSECDRVYAYNPHLSPTLMFEGIGRMEAIHTKVHRASDI